jgi:predicted dehydrogenase
MRTARRDIADAMQKLRILILGTGAMAAQHALHFADDPRVEIVGASDIVPGRAEAFAKARGIGAHFTDIDEAIAWGDFDAAANVTPDNVHYATTMKLLNARKHVLCEKPLAESFAQANEMAVAAGSAGLVNMVNLTYRNVSALTAMRDKIASGEIGEIRHVEASYRQSWLVGNFWGDWKTDPKWLWRLSSKHGSRGVLGDVGVHILDFAAFATGMMPVSVQSRLKTFSKAPDDQIAEYPLDANDSAVMSVEFANGALGVIHASRYMTGYDNVLRLQVFGTDGAIEVQHGTSWTELRMCSGADVHNLAWRHVVPGHVETNHRRFVSAVLAGENAEPSFRRGAELQKVLDYCFENAA